MCNLNTSPVVATETAVGLQSWLGTDPGWKRRPIVMEGYRDFGLNLNT